MAFLRSPRLRSHTAGILVVAAGFAGLAQARPSAWPRFLGPGGIASVSAERIPDTFGPDRNVRWKRAVPPGHSSPVIWGDRLFLTGADGPSLVVLCYRRSDGELLWKKAFETQGKEGFMHRDATPAAPTPVTDGKRVHVYFGAYGLITLNMKGKVVWERKFPVEKSTFGTGSSPVLHDGSLYLVRDVVGLSAVHAFDAATGEERWMTPRAEAAENYSTPFVWRYGDREDLVVAGSSVVKAYDTANGRPRWWVDGVTAIACPSPVASGDLLYFGGWSTPNLPPDRRLETGFSEGSVTEEALKSPSNLLAHLDADKDGSLRPDELPPGRAKDAFKWIDFDGSGTWEVGELQGLLDFPTARGENVLLAIRGGGEGDITGSHVAWRRNKGIPYVATPLLHGGRLYYVKKGGLVSSVDAESGAVVYEAERLGQGGEYYASPVGVGDRVLIGSVRGTMFVLGTGDSLEIVARNDFGEGIFATPAVVDGTLYLRTAGHLWAIGGDE